MSNTPEENRKFYMDRFYNPANNAIRENVRRIDQAIKMVQVDIKEFTEPKAVARKVTEALDGYCEWRKK